MFIITNLTDLTDLETECGPFAVSLTDNTSFEFDYTVGDNLAPFEVYFFNTDTTATAMFNREMLAIHLYGLDD